ncbi:MAG: hypothetical protein EBY24_20155, partial [Betaproteobacteria bacterium]|nr:hypothetical protein [Betaproteobacteria bacterium]
LGAGSTKISRSLASESSLLKADPKTRGFETPYSATSARILSRLRAKTADGFMDLIFFCSVKDRFYDLCPY